MIFSRLLFHTFGHRVLHAIFVRFSNLSDLREMVRKLGAESLREDLGSVCKSITLQQHVDFSSEFHYPIFWKDKNIKELLAGAKGSNYADNDTLSSICFKCSSKCDLCKNYFREVKLFVAVLPSIFTILAMLTVKMLFI